MSRRASAPPILGTSAAGHSHKRSWPPPGPGQAGYVPYTPPAVPAPLQTARSVSWEVLRSKPTKANPAGRITGIDSTLPAGVKIPAGLLAAIKMLADDHDMISLDPLHGLGPDVILSHAIGYQINADGSPRTQAIWEKRTPDEADPRQRVKVGERDPIAVHSLALRIVWRDIANGRPVRILGGWWAGSGDAIKPDDFKVWQADLGAVTLTASSFAYVLRAVLEGHGVTEGIAAAERDRQAAAVRRAEKAAAEAEAEREKANRQYRFMDLPTRNDPPKIITLPDPEEDS